MRLYAESSAVLAWLFGEPQGDDVRRLLAGAEEVLTSVLALVETERVLIRAQAAEGLKEADVMDRRRVLARARRHWHLLGLHDDVVERASHPFPGEPIRTLDAIHLASALAARAAFPELAILSLDASIRRTGLDLGFQLFPGPDKA